MNYKRIYDQIVARGKERVLEGYKECHHIVPRCLGGTDDSDNLVNLTPEEHYVCHQLLVKIHPGNDKLVFAATMMAKADRYGYRSKNKMYGWLRKKHSGKRIEARIRITAECQNVNCSNTFEVRPSEVGRYKCCSWECHRARKRSLTPATSYYERVVKQRKLVSLTT
jgi:hypothetical protein